MPEVISHTTIRPDSIELGTPSKGGALKIYFDSGDPTDALKVKKGQPMPVVENIYTLEEAADKLKMSVRNVRRWVVEGKIKAFKLGREWRIHEDDLQAVIDRARKG